MTRWILVGIGLLLGCAACDARAPKKKQQTQERETPSQVASTAAASSSAALPAQSAPQPVQSAGREDADFARWSSAAKATPPDADAAYNAGQYLYNRKRYDEALAMWQIAKAANANDFDAAKKVVQALNALGRHDEAAAAMSDVRRIFAASTDLGVKKQQEVVIDQLVVRERSVMVYEALSPSDATLHYHWTARVHDPSGKKVELTVQLESSAYGREAGTPFLTGVKRASGHASFESYKALPPYGQWREVAIKRIGEELAR